MPFVYMEIFYAVSPVPGKPLEEIGVQNNENLGNISKPLGIFDNLR